MFSVICRAPACSAVLLCVLPCSYVLCHGPAPPCSYVFCHTPMCFAVFRHVLPSNLPCTYMFCRAPMCTAVLLCYAMLLRG
eukprot:1108256-Pyramimonas_sp.AAC.1